MLPEESTSNHGFGSPSMITLDSQKISRLRCGVEFVSPPLPKSRKPPEFGALAEKAVTFWLTATVRSDVLIVEPEIPETRATLVSLRFAVESVTPPRQE